MTSRIELSGLETVKIRTAPGFIAMAVQLIALLALLGTAVWAVWLVLMDKDSPPPTSDVVAFSILFLAGVLGLWLTRSPFFDCGWITDSEGLTVSGAWRARRILWSQITSAETRWISLFLGRRFVLTTGTGAAYIPTTYPDLAASIWLHLNRIGMASGLKLENDAESLLSPVDEAVADELDWENPCPPSISKISLLAAIVVAAMLLLKCFAHSHALVYFGGILLTVILSSALSKLTAARRCSVRSDHFEADTILRKIRVRWEDVKSAQWSEIKDGVRLCISWYSSVFLPWNRDDEESHALIATIAKHLRDRSPQLLLAIPREAEEE